MSKLRVLLTDDHALFRQGIRTLLSLEPDMEVVGEASSASEAVELGRQLRPDVVLMDIGMTGMSSFEATRLIRKERRKPASSSSPCTTTRIISPSAWKSAPAATSSKNPVRSTAHRHPRSAPRRQLPQPAPPDAPGGRFPR